MKRKIDSETGFTIPENYFRDLNGKILSQLDKNEQMNTIPDKRKLSFYYWPIAASIILGGFAFILFDTKETQTVSFKTELNNTDTSIINNYISSVELNDEEFEYYVPNTVIDSLYVVEIAEPVYDGITQEDLEDLEEEYSALEEIDL